MIKKCCFVFTIVLVLTLSGCGRSNYPELPDNAIAFEMGTLEDTEHDAALFGTLEYNGRIYIGYGTINNAFKNSDVNQCIGYVVMDENSTSNPDPNDMSIRIYTLYGDDDHKFLMEHDSASGLMNQPSIWRAIDTRGKGIDIPNYIDALEYDYWK